MNSNRLDVLGDKVLIVAREEVELRDLANGQTLGKRTGDNGSANLVGCIVGNCVVTGGTIQVGNPSSVGVRVLNGPTLLAVSNLVLKATPKAILRTVKPNFFAATYNDGVTTVIQAYEIVQSGSTISVLTREKAQLPYVMADARSLPNGNIAVLAMNGTVDIINSTTFSSVKKTTIPLGISNFGRIAGDGSVIAFSGVSDNKIYAWNYNTGEMTSFTALNGGTKSVSVVGGRVFYGTQKTSTTQFSLADNTGILGPVSYPAEDIVPYGNDLLLTDATGFIKKSFGSAPPVTPPVDTDKGLTGTLNVVLSPAGPDGKRAVVSCTGVFENVK